MGSVKRNAGRGRKREREYEKNAMAIHTNIHSFGGERQWRTNGGNKEGT